MRYWLPAFGLTDFTKTNRKAQVLMSAGKMHADEVDIDVSLVGRLLAAQFPQWADLPIEPVHSAGTDNAIYRLGEDMAVRLPRIEGPPGKWTKSTSGYRNSPRTCRLPFHPAREGNTKRGLSLALVRLPMARRRDATIERITDPGQAARDLAQFVAALQRIDSAGGPSPGAHNSFRGVPLSTRDAETRAAIASLDGMIDTGAVTAAWDAALRRPFGMAHPSGSTETCHLGTCSSSGAGSAPSSTSGVWA